ncbi:branched-chain amino acid ABC transporter permease [Roseivivax halodurans JCM 10272]|uniref:Branched-chain amino acid ABC transporter permease n=1 Tax=Roseivivax halodurans JCM 10272 TaxID=1449350 RepID=X7EBK7_9RHOB|nr:urea ABC transporter permease subunit UrtB [Roseivivax halodurans]ETX13250.1 branched-chain amino acid ABC transporter permease [Roseivivax halodurans JCM 10272]
MLRALVLFLTALLACAAPPAVAQDSQLQAILQTHADEVADPGRRSVGPLIDDLAASGLPGIARFLDRWSNKQVFLNAGDGLFYYGARDGETFALRDIASDEPVGTAPASALEEIRPNGGVRRVIGSALVQFQLSDPDRATRVDALDALARRPAADQLEPLRASIEGEPDPALKARKERLAGLLTARFGEGTETRVAAIEDLADATDIETRAGLNRILASRSEVAETLPEGVNLARVLEIGPDLSEADAYSRLVDDGLAPAPVTNAEVKTALTANIQNGAVAGIPVEQLSDPDRRTEAYAALAASGAVPPLVTPEAQAEAVASHVFYEVYEDPDPVVTEAARSALDTIEARVARFQVLDIGLDAVSLASIYFLAAIGLAITFGVMGVINMAHGEFIMMGAYTGYVVQQIVPNYTASLVVALPLAFAVTFAAGVALERLVIRHLYHRPLETLLATFGISIALQQLAKNIFGTQARPLTAPDWLGGAWVMGDVVAIANIRIAIFVLALIFLCVLLYILKRTRLGLEVRAATQNPGMAGSMGIDPGRINMLTFGLGSGIAGIAGVAIGLYAQVTSEMGSAYIVQSFMTVVVGGVGNVWGTLAGATLIGGLQKGIEWFNPSNTLAAQTYMILFIILFIQVRPKGIVALKGRAAGD